MQETDKIRDKVVLVGLNSPVLKREENAGEDTLEEMAAGERLRAFFKWGEEKPPECGACRWRRLCNGGCKNDWLSGPVPHNYFCSALRQFFAHAESRLLYVAQTERAMGRNMPS